MIPATIHYCWFGGTPKNKLVETCIASWKMHMPECEIVEWNESNFDVNSTVFTKQAHQAKKWAFVSDYVRLYALYEYGGIYLDSDIELLKPLNIFMKYPGFGGFSDTVTNGGNYEIPSAVMGAEKNNLWIGEMLKDDGSYCLETNASIMTRLSWNYFKHENVQQTMTVGDIEIFPMEYFEPINPVNNVNVFSLENSYAIHWHNCSWAGSEGWRERIRLAVKKIIGKINGDEKDDKMARRDMWLAKMNIKRS